ELVVISVDEHNWKGIGISLIVIAAIFSVIGLAIFILTPKDLNDNYGIYKLELDDIIGTKFKAKLFNGTWISDLFLQVFVCNNDIYYVPYMGANATRMTHSGEAGTVYNGVSDWLYANRINPDESHSSIWWSKNGTSIIYATFNDSEVPSNPIKLYGGISEAVTRVYVPKILMQKYTKAGLENKNPVVTLWLIDLSNSSGSTPKQIIPPLEIVDKEHYLTYVQWTSDDEVMVMWTLRTQNQSVLTLCSRKNEWMCTQITKISSTLLTLKELSEAILPIETHAYFIRAPRPDTQIGSYYHIAYNKIDKQESTYTNFLTYGDYDVTKLLGFDLESKTLYYQSSKEPNSEQRHIFNLVLDDQEKNVASQCLTCDLKDDCTFYDALFSPTSKYYILQCLGPKVPFTQLWEATGNKSKLRTIMDNNDLRARLKDKRLPSIRIMTVPIENLTPPVKVKVMIPPPKPVKPKVREDDEEEIIRYPLIVESTTQASKLIVDQYMLDWGTYVASKKEFIYAKIDIDERNQRNGHIKFNYKKYNFEIQLQVINYLVQEIQEIDANRIAIWGVGIAAFNALSSLASDTNEMLRCAVAVSPVTNWRYLDSVTTEYFLGMPSQQENYATYETISLMSKIPHLLYKRFLIIHGTADTEFHIQHSMLFSKALIQNYKSGSINYQFQMYPDDDHDFSKSKFHVYKLMEAFIEKCFATPRVNKIESSSDS
ncbi:prolyl endopeptidase FAP-like protein, partial [Dinothrombium tinctorium]